MLVFPGSMNFTSHPGVLIAPRAPIDPNEQGPSAGGSFTPKGELRTETLRGPSSKLSHGGLKTNNKIPHVVDPLLFYALTFSQASWVL